MSTNGAVVEILDKRNASLWHSTINFDILSTFSASSSDYGGRLEGLNFEALRLPDPPVIAM